MKSSQPERIAPARSVVGVMPVLMGDSLPSRDDDPPVGIERDRVAALRLEVAVERPPGPPEREECHRGDHPDVHPDHTDAGPGAELAGRPPARGEEGNRVAVGVPVDQGERLLERVGPGEPGHRAEDLLPADRHLGPHVLEDGGPDPVAGRAAGPPGPPPPEQRPGAPPPSPWATYPATRSRCGAEITAPMVTPGSSPEPRVSEAAPSSTRSRIGR